MNNSHLNENGSSKYLNTVMSSKTNFMKDSETDENEFDDNIIKNEYLYNSDDKEINNIIRNHVFSKIGSKRYNTSMNLEIKRENEDDDENNDENNDKDNDEDNDENDNHKEIIYKKDKKVNFNKNGSTDALKRNNNNSKIKIKKNYRYLLTESKNRNRSGYL